MIYTSRFIHHKVQNLEKHVRDYQSLQQKWEEEGAKVGIYRPSAVCTWTSQQSVCPMMLFGVVKNTVIVLFPIHLINIEACWNINYLTVPISEEQNWYIYAEIFLTYEYSRIDKGRHEIVLRRISIKSFFPAYIDSVAYCTKHTNASE